MADGRDKETGKFAPGHKYAVGRKGARNRLQGDLIVALGEHFAEFGKTAVEIVYRESPRDYLKIMVSVLPKEFILEDGRLESMGDDELEDYLTEIRRRRLEPNRELVIEGTATKVERE